QNGAGLRRWRGSPEGWLTGPGGGPEANALSLREATALGSGPAGATAVDIEPTPTTAGYWLLTADGRVTRYGDATALGNLDTGRLPAGEQVTSLSSGTPTGKGYRVFTSRGRAV